MREFKGWTPKTIERLTFDQLDAILESLNSRRESIDECEISLAKIKSILYGYFRINDTARVDDEIDPRNVPSAKASSLEIDAWTGAGCPPTFDSFVAKMRKVSNNGR